MESVRHAFFDPMSTNRKAIDVASILSNEEMKNFQRHMYTMCGILVGTPLLCLGFARGFRAYGKYIFLNCIY